MEWIARATFYPFCEEAQRNIDIGQDGCWGRAEGVALRPERKGEIWSVELVGDTQSSTVDELSVDPTETHSGDSERCIGTHPCDAEKRSLTEARAPSRWCDQGPSPREACSGLCAVSLSSSSPVVFIFIFSCFIVLTVI